VLLHTQVLNKGGEKRSSENAAESLNFLVLGDWGRNGKNGSAEVAAAMAGYAARRDSAFVVSTGDNFYGDGITTDTDSQIQTSWRDVFDLSVLKSWYLVLGNHDYYGNASAQLSIRDPEWNMPARYYSKLVAVGFSQVLLVFLDTVPMIAKYRNSEYLRSKHLENSSMAHSLSEADPVHTQLSWLELTLKESTACMIFAFAHSPMYADGPPSDALGSVQMLLEPLFLQYGVDSFITGHSHSMQARVVHGVHHLISGAGSALDVLESPRSATWSQSINGFLSVSVNQSGVEFEAVGVNQGSLYRTGIAFDPHNNPCYSPYSTTQVVSHTSHQ